MTAERFLSPYYYHDLLQVAQNEDQIQLLLEIRELVASNTAKGLMKVETHERRQILDIDKELVQRFKNVADKEARNYSKVVNMYLLRYVNSR